MKMLLLLGSLLLGTTTTFAQALDVNGLKNLLTSKQTTLERVNAGMTKKIITTSSEGACGLMTTATQIVLKVDGAKMYILSKEKLQPQNTPACRTAGYTASVLSNIVYMEDKPSLRNDLSDLESIASNIKAITKDGDLVTLNVEVNIEDESGTANSEKVTIKYDMTKPSFKNMISSQSINYKTVIEDAADSDLTKVDLTKVSFCDNNDGDESECIEGDFSDILF